MTEREKTRGGQRPIRLMLQRGAEVLYEHGVPNARLNAEWILCDALGCSRIDLFVGSAAIPGDDRAREYWTNIERRAGREPLQHILGTTEFMSLPFFTPPDVFVPRPDTEILVELAESNLRRVPVAESLSALDLCCGTGVIAISLAARIPNLFAVAVDESQKAITATERNAISNGVQDRVAAFEAEAVSFLRGDEPFPKNTGLVNGARKRNYPHRFNAILCNPPYIESSLLEKLPPEVREYEPRTALDGGEDGLGFYRTVLPILPLRLKRGGFAAFEIGDTQGADVSGMMRDTGFGDVTVVPDYAGRDRVVIGTHRSRD